MTKKLRDCDKFKFLTERSLKEKKIELTRWQSAQLRGKLPRGIYWIQIAKGGLIQWNWRILNDFLIFGNRPEHQELIEEFLETLQ